MKVPVTGCTDDITETKGHSYVGVFSRKRLNEAGSDQLLRTPIFTFKQGL